MHVDRPFLNLWISNEDEEDYVRILLSTVRRLTVVEDERPGEELQFGGLRRLSEAMTTRIAQLLCGR